MLIIKEPVVMVSLVVCAWREDTPKHRLSKKGTNALKPLKQEVDVCIEKDVSEETCA
jgi:hypothetical protein